MLSTILLSLTLLYTLYFLTTYILLPYYKIRSYRKKGLPTDFFPIIGPIWRTTRDFHTTGDFEHSSKTFNQQYPNKKLLVSNAGTKPLFILRDPMYLKEFLKNPSLYEKHKFMDFIKCLLGNGLVTAEGETWKAHRKIISSCFHYEFLKSSVQSIQEITREFLDKIPACDYKGFKTTEKLEEITSQVVARIFFGKNISEYSVNGKSITKELAEIVPELSLCGRTPLVLIFGAKALDFSFVGRYKRIMARIKAFRGVILEIIKDRRANPQDNCDLLGALISSKGANKDGQGLSDDDIIDEFITFFLAGMETTEHLCTMTLYNLSLYPQYLADLTEERKKTYKTESIPTIETLQKMTELHSVLKETLRFYTPTPALLPRTVLEDHKIADLQVRKGDVILPDFMAVFFNENYFEDPYKFEPRRWKNAEGNMDPYAFTPFSGGPRNCIGQHLAMIEAKIIMSEFLERFEFRVKEGYKLKMFARLTYEPEEQVLLDLTRINK